MTATVTATQPWANRQVMIGLACVALGADLHGHRRRTCLGLRVRRLRARPDGQQRGTATVSLLNKSVWCDGVTAGVRKAIAKTYSATLQAASRGLSSGLSCHGSPASTKCLATGRPGAHDRPKPLRTPTSRTRKAGWVHAVARAGRGSPQAVAHRIARRTTSHCRF